MSQRVIAHGDIPPLVKERGFFLTSHINIKISGMGYWSTGVMGIAD
jgi:hypothetical protein